MSAVKRLYDRAIEALGLARGTTAADGASPIQTVQVIFTTTGGLRSSVQLMQHYGFASRPHEGCDYAVLALGGDPTKSFIVASNDQRYRISLAEGEAALHDDQGQSVHITRAGIVMTDKSGSVISMLGGSITLAPANGIVTVDGEISGSGEGGTGVVFTGDIKTQGDVIAGVGTENISLINHKQQNGGGTGLSGPPQPNT